MTDKDTILVQVRDSVELRGQMPKDLKVEVLADSVNLFMTQIDGILAKAPTDVAGFEFVELTVSAEISAKGGLVLLGTGVEAAVKGGLTFKFSRKR